MSKIGILLVEDHRMVRQGFLKILGLQSDFEVLGEAEEGRRAVALASALCPAVVVMDIAMPLLNGLEAARQMLRERPELRIVLVSAYGELGYVKRALELGVGGFLLKHSSVEDLYLAIRRVAAGGSFFPRELLRRFRVSLASGKGEAVRAREGDNFGRGGLSVREMEVLQLIAEGYSNKQTAAELGIGIKTVEKHRGHIMEKLGVHETAGLTRYALETGVVECRGLAKVW
ncbi:MAG: response regulator transcription factor [Verrucomicrobiota bacterium]